MRAVVLAAEPDSVDPLIYEPRRPTAALQPFQDACPRRLEQLELRRSAGLLLDDDRPLSRARHSRHSRSWHLDEVAAAQLAVERQVEERILEPKC
jgi:hypothetical protein